MTALLRNWTSLQRILTGALPVMLVSVPLLACLSTSALAAGRDVGTQIAVAEKQKEKAPEKADSPKADSPAKGDAAADAKDKPPVKPAYNPHATGVIKEFPAASIDGVLREAFKCALDFSDESSGFSCYAALNVDSNHDNDVATTQLRKFQWAAFRRRAAGFVVEGKEFAVRITRRDPDRVPADAKEAKLFLHSRERDNPAPITFRREAGQWRIYANSLGF